MSVYISVYVNGKVYESLTNLIHWYDAVPPGLFVPDLSMWVGEELQRQLTAAFTKTHYFALLSAPEEGDSAANALARSKHAMVDQMVVHDSGYDNHMLFRTPPFTCGETRYDGYVIQAL